MKMSAQRYNELLTAIRALVDFVGPDKVRERYAAPDANHTRLNFTLLYKAVENLRYDDSHPFYERGIFQRFTPHIPGFELYTDPHTGEALHDDHIATALRKIARELGLTA